MFWEEFSMTLARGSRVSLFGWARVVATVAALLAFPAVSAWPAAEALQILQPDCLSTLEATPLQVRVTADHAGTVAYTLTLSDEEDRCSACFTGRFPREGSGMRAPLWVEPSDLAAFSLGETWPS